MNIPLPESLGHRPVLSSFLWGAACAAVAAIASSLAGGTGPLDPDGFGLIARSVYEGRGFVYSTPTGLVPAFERGPVYPLTVAAVMWATAGFHLWKVAILHILLHGGSVALVQRLGQRVMSVRLSLVAAFLVGLHPLLLWYTLRIWSEPLLTFLLLWAADAALRAGSFNRWRQWLELGVICAAAALTKPVALVILFLPFMPGTTRGFRSLIGRFFAVLAVVAALVGVWVVHCYNERGGVDAAHTGLGFNLMQGSQIARSLPALPISSMENWHAAKARIDTLLAGRKGDGFTPANDRFLTQTAIRERIGAPVSALATIAVNGMTFWYLAETPAKSILAALVQIPLLLIVIVHAHRLWMSHLVHRIALALIGSCWLVHALIVGWVRYSVPVTPFVLLLAASAVASFHGRNAKR